MKLINFKNISEYKFIFTFENGEIKKVDLKNLISKKVAIKELNSVKIDSEWGCLEFKDGLVDIEPKTLFNYSKQLENKIK